MPYVWFAARHFCKTMKGFGFVYPVPYLEGIFRKLIIRLICSCYLLAKLYFSMTDGRKVKMHVQV